MPIIFLANVFRFVPTIFLDHLAFLFATLLLLINHRLYKRLLNNHRFIYPEKSENKLKKLSKISLKSFIQNQLYSLKMMKRKGIISRFAVSGKGVEELRSALNDSAVILVVPHLSVNYLPVLALEKSLKRQIIVPIRGTTHDQIIEKQIYQYLSTKQVKMQLLGGAMGEIEQIVKNKGIIILALDAILPIKYKLIVDFFSSRFAMSSGALWLADRFSLPIFSVCSILQKKQMKVVIEHIDLSSIDNNEEKLARIAKRLEGYIVNNPGSWNLDDDLFALATSKSS